MGLWNVNELVCTHEFAQVLLMSSLQVWESQEWGVRRALYLRCDIDSAPVAASRSFPSWREDAPSEKLSRWIEQRWLKIVALGSGKQMPWSKGPKDNLITLMSLHQASVADAVIINPCQISCQFCQVDAWRVGPEKIQTDSSSGFGRCYSWKHHLMSVSAGLQSCWVLYYFPPWFSECTTEVMKAQQIHAFHRSRLSPVRNAMPHLRHCNVPLKHWHDFRWYSCRSSGPSRV